MIIKMNEIIIEDPVEQCLLYWALTDYSLDKHNLENVIIARDMLYVLKQYVIEHHIRHFI